MGEGRGVGFGFCFFEGPGGKKAAVEVVGCGFGVLVLLGLILVEQAQD